MLTEQSLYGTRNQNINLNIQITQEILSNAFSLIIEQQVKCKHCGLILKEDDILEIDYFLSKILGKKELISFTKI